MCTSSAGDNVKVDVIHLLSSFGTAVHADTVSSLAVARGLGDPSRGEQTATDVLDVAVLKRLNSRDVALRNHEHVQRRLRIDVLEREHAIVLVLDIGRTIPHDDATEETLGDRGAGRASRHGGLL